MSEKTEVHSEGKRSSKKRKISINQNESLKEERSLKVRKKSEDEDNKGATPKPKLVGLGGQESNKLGLGNRSSTKLGLEEQVSKSKSSLEDHGSVKENEVIKEGEQQTAKNTSLKDQSVNKNEPPKDLKSPDKESTEKTGPANASIKKVDGNEQREVDGLNKDEGIGPKDKSNSENLPSKTDSKETDSSREPQNEQTMNNEVTKKDIKGKDPNNSNQDQNNQDPNKNEDESSSDEDDWIREEKKKRVERVAQWRKKILKEIPGKIDENFTALQRHLLANKKAVDDFVGKIEEEESKVVKEQESGEINFKEEISKLEGNLNKRSCIHEEYEKWMEMRHEFIPNDS